ncbi:GNAT family N-acetyltransferase [Streptomyces syringium]|uniref:GNAT family N-acetyltransferase n=1 Tax=Streptomyces syringium TaxID=76729 RepID=UPI0036A20A6E
MDTPVYDQAHHRAAALLHLLVPGPGPETLERAVRGRRGRGLPSRLRASGQRDDQRRPKRSWTSSSRSKPGSSASATSPPHSRRGPADRTCAIELKSSGEFIGRSGLQYWEQFDEVELGWTLRADHWGHGYATEAAQACLDWGFAALDDEYFTALIRPGNEASVRVAERLGFTPRREDHLQGRPVTVYAVDRPAKLLAT